VYADQSSRAGQLEGAPVLGLLDGMTDPGELYGARKAAAERIVAEVYGERALIPRPGHVRDLGAWIADACHRARSGVFSLAGDPGSFGRFLHDCEAATYSEAELAWIPASRLLAAGVEPWMGIPMWIGDPALPGINDVDNSRAAAAGLACRPAIETIRDTLAWDLARGGPGEEGLTSAEEERLLRELVSRA
jgi:2'-hydroxyisoflavone reductase